MSQSVPHGTATSATEVKPPYSEPLPLNSCLAKTWQSPTGLRPGRTVEEHCRIAGAVARALAGRLGPAARACLPDRAHVPALVHDVGKVCPTFQKKLYGYLGRADQWPQLDGIDPAHEKDWGWHAAISAAVVDALSDDRVLAHIVGLHHGRGIQENAADADKYGGPPWQAAREALVARLLENEAEGQSWPEFHGLAETLLVSGLMVAADWIASGERFGNPDEDWRPLVDGALDAAGFIRPALRAGLSFEQVFSFSPNAMQQDFVAGVSGPGIYILEAPMGLGKTEAALYAAYRAMERGQADGLYFGLPTQLTSNAIHARINAFLGRILEDGGHAVLTHGGAWLRRFLEQEMGRDAAPGGTWFEQSRRGLLAPFAVGTIDQALMAVIRVPFAGLRALGLAGKVVILDEVHSYDAYTGVLVEELARVLRGLNCTVIILSATLTAGHRARFGAPPSVDGDAANEPYPLITALPARAATSQRHPTPPASAKVALRHCADDALALEQALLRAEQGQQVLWIENTVADAQERYRLLAARAGSMGLEAGLLHSRFTPQDRERNEARWTALYGGRDPVSVGERSRCGRVLVGTQVLEQSLDIDADFLVTRFCPTDMLLQRLGRLWRHERPQRATGASREAWLLAPGLDAAREQPKSAFGISALIYSAYVLCRSLEVWEGREAVTLPPQIRELLEATYAPRENEATDALKAARAELRAERERLRGLALHGLSRLGKLLDEESVKARYVQREPLALLLLRRFDAASGECLLADGSPCRLSRERLPASARRAASARLALNLVRIPEPFAPRAAPDLLPWFEAYLPEARDGARFRAALLLPGGGLADLNGIPLDGLRYSGKIGYSIAKG